MYLPLPLRLALFYTLILALALLFFGHTVYDQAAQRAYADLDATLSNRAESVQLGKNMLIMNGISSPVSLPGTDGLAPDGVAIEVLDNHLHLLASNTLNNAGPVNTTVIGLPASLVPWDASAARFILQHPLTDNNQPNSMYSTITYAGQQVRVYTTISNNYDQNHIIQTARSEQDIQQSLSNLRTLLWQGAALVLLFAFGGGWLLTWATLAAVRRVTRTALAISASRDFSRRVPTGTGASHDELSALASTFNQMLANLQEAYQRQQRFVADASHELRAPITSIRCNLDLLARATDLPPEEVQAALHDTRAEADRMGRLVNDLLILARSDVSQANTSSTPSEQAQAEDTAIYGYKKFEKIQPVDLDSLLLEVFRQYRPERQQAGNDDSENGSRQVQGQHRPRLVLHDIIPARVSGDADQLKQALVALLDNALKYTPYEGTVSLSLTVEQASAIIKVSDTGIGILPEDLPHIFERFYRADRARSRDRGGSGLGLAIAQSIVQAHRGSIEVESTPGKGSIFTVRLPVTDHAETP
jgi:two-component system OmpR family sensor kinase